MRRVLSDQFPAIFTYFLGHLVKKMTDALAGLQFEQKVPYL